MANREWFITKLAGSVMGILLLISMGVTVANLHFDLKRDVDRIDVDLIDHKVSDDKKWDKADAKIDKHGTDINQLRLDTQKNAQYYMEIMRILSEMKKDSANQFDKLNIKFDSLEVYEQ